MLLVLFDESLLEATSSVGLPASIIRFLLHRRLDRSISCMGDRYLGKFLLSSLQEIDGLPERLGISNWFDEVALHRRLHRIVCVIGEGRPLD